MLLALVAGSSRAFGQPVDTVGFAGAPGSGKVRLSTAWLRPGLHQYMIYMHDSSQKRTMTYWYWLRQIEKSEVNGESCFRISQHWLGQDSAFYRESLSINRAEDFSPLYYKAVKNGKTYAYRWSDKAVTGDDTAAGNMAKDFSLSLERPGFNWELDMETFEMLPLAEGRSFVFNFYDAGLQPPMYVACKVVGSEVLPMLDGAQTDCWKLVSEGQVKETHYTETYWISKKGHVFIKEEDHFGSMFRLKMLMPENTPDPLHNFRG